MLPLGDPKEKIYPIVCRITEKSCRFADKLVSLQSHKQLAKSEPDCLTYKTESIMGFICILLLLCWLKG